MAWGRDETLHFLYFILPIIISPTSCTPRHTSTPYNQPSNWRLQILFPVLDERVFKIPLSCSKAKAPGPQVGPPSSCHIWSEPLGQTITEDPVCSSRRKTRQNCNTDWLLEKGMGAKKPYCSMSCYHPLVQSPTASDHQGEEGETPTLYYFF